MLRLKRLQLTLLPMLERHTPFIIKMQLPWDINFTFPKSQLKKLFTPFLPTLAFGINPRGLLPNMLWQVDRAHVPSFGRWSFVHETVDTFSHVIITTARTGEAFKEIIQHLFTCFSYVRIPKALKTHNAPAYTSKSFRAFCTQFQIAHSTGIPYKGISLKDKL